MRSSRCSIGTVANDGRWSKVSTPCARRLDRPARRDAWRRSSSTWPRGENVGAEARATEASRDPKFARLARAGAVLVKLLGRTWRINASYDAEIKRLRAAGRPIVFSLWHGDLLPL